MATHFSSIFNELSLQPGDADGIRRLLNSYPYFETPYILKALTEKDNARTLHNAALMNKNPAWLHALLQPEAPVQHTTVVEEKPVQEEKEPIQNEPVPETVDQEPVTSNKELVTENTEPAQEQSTPVLNEPLPATSNQQPATSNQEPVTENPEPVQNIPVPIQNAPLPETSNKEQEISNQQPVTSNQQPVTSNQQPATDVPATAISFEPFHTVDYFASQGIKPAKDILPSDRFSHQLRSFTEWLKTMKKLPGGQIESLTRPGQQEEVVQLAETSLKKTEVLTETMAEVLVKQGRTNEAIEILQKLSLLDKAKSAYFAARIQHLKSI